LRTALPAQLPDLQGQLSFTPRSFAEPLHVCASVAQLSQGGSALDYECFDFVGHSEPGSLGGGPCRSGTNECGKENVGELE
jgi:hypothetical protein